MTTPLGPTVMMSSGPTPLGIGATAYGSYRASPLPDRYSGGPACRWRLWETGAWGSVPGTQRRRAGAPRTGLGLPDVETNGCVGSHSVLRRLVTPACGASRDGQGRRASRDGASGRVVWRRPGTAARDPAASRLRAQGADQMAQDGTLRDATGAGLGEAAALGAARAHVRALMAVAKPAPVQERA